MFINEGKRPPLSQMGPNNRKTRATWKTSKYVRNGTGRVGWSSKGAKRWNKVLSFVPNYDVAPTPTRPPPSLCPPPPFVHPASKSTHYAQPSRHVFHTCNPSTCQGLLSSICDSPAPSLPPCLPKLGPTKVPPPLINASHPMWMKQPICTWRRTRTRMERIRKRRRNCRKARN